MKHNKPNGLDRFADTVRPQRTRRAMLVIAFLTFLAALNLAYGETVVSIQGGDFHLNGKPTYAGREWRGHRVEGLLMNSRMVQATFDDLNPETAGRWKYPDTGKWDAERNVREFIGMMPEWRKHGLLSFTVNFQGGSPEGYSRLQPWENNAFNPDGSMRPAFLDRMKRVLDEADRLGMVPIVGYFYFGQSPRFRDEDAVRTATDNVTQWLLAGGWRNLLVEVNNEANKGYRPEILRINRVHELIARVRDTKAADGRRLLVGTSFAGNVIPTPEVIAVSDFALIHGNGVKDPKRIVEMVKLTRALPTWRTMPVLFNEDDHFDFDQPMNNFIAAVSEHASWGYFDYRMKGEGFDEGYQSMPVNWTTSSDRKRGFFKLCGEITGSKP
jgi:hypothetical protein